MKRILFFLAMIFTCFSLSYAQEFKAGKISPVKDELPTVILSYNHESLTITAKVSDKGDNAGLKYISVDGRKEVFLNAAVDTLINFKALPYTTSYNISCVVTDIGGNTIDKKYRIKIKKDFKDFLDQPFVKIEADILVVGDPNGDYENYRSMHNGESWFGLRSDLFLGYKKEKYYEESSSFSGLNLSFSKNGSKKHKGVLYSTDIGAKFATYKKIETDETEFVFASSISPVFFHKEFDFLLENTELEKSLNIKNKENGFGLKTQLKFLFGEYEGMNYGGEEYSYLASIKLNADINYYPNVKDFGYFLSMTICGNTFIPNATFSFERIPYAGSYVFISNVSFGIPFEMLFSEY